MLDKYDFNFPSIATSVLGWDEGCEGKRTQELPSAFTSTTTTTITILSPSKVKTLKAGSEEQPSLELVKDQVTLEVGEGDNNVTYKGEVAFLKASRSFKLEDGDDVRLTRALEPEEIRPPKLDGGFGCNYA